MPDRKRNRSTVNPSATRQNWRDDPDRPRAGLLYVPFDKLTEAEQSLEKPQSSQERNLWQQMVAANERATLWLRKNNEKIKAENARDAARYRAKGYVPFIDWEKSKEEWEEFKTTLEVINEGASNALEKPFIGFYRGMGALAEFAGDKKDARWFKNRAGLLARHDPSAWKTPSLAAQIRLEQSAAFGRGLAKRLVPNAALAPAYEVGVGGGWKLGSYIPLPYGLGKPLGAAIGYGAVTFGLAPEIEKASDDLDRFMTGEYYDVVHARDVAAETAQPGSFQTGGIVSQWAIQNPTNLAAPAKQVAKQALQGAGIATVANLGGQGVHQWQSKGYLDPREFDYWNTLRDAAGGGLFNGESARWGKPGSNLAANIVEAIPVKGAPRRGLVSSEEASLKDGEPESEASGKRKASGVKRRLYQLEGSPDILPDSGDFHFANDDGTVTLVSPGDVLPDFSDPEFISVYEGQVRDPETGKRSPVTHSIRRRPGMDTAQFIFGDTGRGFLDSVESKSSQFPRPGRSSTVRQQNAEQTNSDTAPSNTKSLPSLLELLQQQARRASGSLYAGFDPTFGFLDNTDLRLLESMRKKGLASHIPPDATKRTLPSDIVAPLLSQFRFLKPSNDQFLFRLPDASALIDYIDDTGSRTQSAYYSKRKVPLYEPRRKDSKLFPLRYRFLGGGIPFGQRPNVYGRMVGASAFDPVVKTHAAADRAPLVAFSVLDDRNVMQELSPLRLFLRELKDDVYVGARSAADVDAAVAGAAKHPDILSLDDALADLATNDPPILNSLARRNNFLNRLTGKRRQEKYGMPPYDWIQDRLIEYPHANYGDVVALGIINHDPLQTIVPLPMSGLPAHDTFKYGLPGLHLGDTIPSLNIFDLMSEHITVPIRNSDGSFNKKVLNQVKYALDYTKQPRPSFLFTPEQVKALAHE